MPYSAVINLLKQMFETQEFVIFVIRIEWWYVSHILNNQENEQNLAMRKLLDFQIHSVFVQRTRFYTSVETWLWILDCNVAILLRSCNIIS